MLLLPTVSVALPRDTLLPVIPVSEPTDCGLPFNTNDELIDVKDTAELAGRPGGFCEMEVRVTSSI